MSYIDELIKKKSEKIFSDINPFTYLIDKVKVNNNDHKNITVNKNNNNELILNNVNNEVFDEEIIDLMYAVDNYNIYIKENNNANINEDKPIHMYHTPEHNFSIIRVKHIHEHFKNMDGNSIFSFTSVGGKPKTNKRKKIKAKKINKRSITKSKKKKRRTTR